MIDLTQVELSEIERATNELANRGVSRLALELLFTTHFSGTGLRELKPEQRREWLNILRRHLRGELSFSGLMQPELPFRRTID